MLRRTVLAHSKEVNMKKGYRTLTIGLGVAMLFALAEPAAAR